MQKMSTWIAPPDGQGMQLACGTATNLDRSLENNIDGSFFCDRQHIWQLQELEWGLANYLVLRLKDARGVGLQRGSELLSEASKRTFGTLLSDLSKAGVFEAALAERLKKILDDRNWLVHRSRRDHPNIITSRQDCEKLIARIEEITTEATTLLRMTAQLLEKHLLEHGVSSLYIERETQRLMTERGVFAE